MHGQACNKRSTKQLIYSGPKPCIALNVYVHILNMIRILIGSQCSLRRAPQDIGPTHTVSSTVLHLYSREEGRARVYKITCASRSTLADNLFQCNAPIGSLNSGLLYVRFGVE